MTLNLQNSYMQGFGKSQHEEALGKGREAVFEMLMTPSLCSFHTITFPAQFSVLSVADRLEGVDTGRNELVFE